MAKLAIRGGTPVRRQPYPLWPFFDEREKQFLIEVLESRQWGRMSGQMNELFEKKFGEFQQAKYVTTVCNGTVALRIALFAVGVGPGDEVIVPSYTFVATATSVIEANAIPVMADIDPHTFNMDPKAVEALITERTRAIIPVHFGGAPTNMDEIIEIARKNNLAVIEDAAQAQGAAWKGKKAGTLGDVGTFSFQLSKNMTSGEGGALVTNNPEIAERIRRFYNCGRKPGYAWYYHFEISGNYRLSEFQAAVLLAQLEREEANIRTRTARARYLTKELQAIPGIEPVVYADYVESSWYLFLLKYRKEAFKNISKMDFVRAMNAEGIPVMEGYPFPLYKQPLFQDAKFWKNGCPFNCSFYGKAPNYKELYHPHAEEACEVGLWLPNYVLHGSESDLDDVVRAIRKIQTYADEIKE